MDAKTRGSAKRDGGASVVRLRDAERSINTSLEVQTRVAYLAVQGRRSGSYAGTPVTRNTLAALHRAWGLPTDNELRWLLRQGVSEASLWPIGGTRVRFDHRHGTFDPDVSCARALTFRAKDRGRDIDLIAWQPKTGELASWRGQAFCLGDQDDIFNPATYFAGHALRIHETPLDWLLADREGIVILRPEWVAAYLASCQRVRVSCATYARQVEKWLQPHKPKVEILVEVEERGAA